MKKFWDAARKSRTPQARKSRWEHSPTVPVGRRGSALVAAIVAFAVCAVVLFSVLKGTLDQQRKMRSHRQQVQADWLATAGIDRAIAKLQQSSDYTGETWRVPAEQLGKGADAAEVVIKVEPGDNSNHRQVNVQADYPADTIHRSRKTKQAMIEIP